MLVNTEFSRMSIGINGRYVTLLVYTDEPSVSSARINDDFATGFSETDVWQRPKRTI